MNHSSSYIEPLEPYDSITYRFRRDTFQSKTAYAVDISGVLVRPRSPSRSRYGTYFSFFMLIYSVLPKPMAFCGAYWESCFGEINRYIGNTHCSQLFKFRGHP